MYFRKLAPHGLLMVHLSNRHLRLAPVVAGTAAALGVVARLRKDEDEKAAWASRRRRGPSWRERRRTWAGSRTTRAGPTTMPGNRSKPITSVPLWTDDYSSIVSVMNWAGCPSGSG